MNLIITMIKHDTISIKTNYEVIKVAFQLRSKKRIKVMSKDQNLIKRLEQKSMRFMTKYIHGS